MNELERRAVFELKGVSKLDTDYWTWEKLEELIHIPAEDIEQEVALEVS